MIPSTAHFIWFGNELRWLHAMAIRTAALHGGFDRVILHCDTPLERLPVWRELIDLPHFEVRPIDLSTTLRRCGGPGERLEKMVARLDKPAAKANVLRAALLQTEGGVYLDTDTVTLRRFDDLRAGFGAFCGEEHIVFPETVASNRHPATIAKALTRSAVREGLRLAPDGWSAFTHVAPWYHRAVNNAVLGSRRGHPLMGRLLNAMASTPDERVTRRFALGTHLLQRTLADHREPDLWVAPPAVFYPLGPEISQHWFRPTRRPRLDEMLRPETRVVHWYASVRCKDLLPQVDRDWVRSMASEVPLAALLARVMDQQPTTREGVVGRSGVRAERGAALRTPVARDAEASIG